MALGYVGRTLKKTEGQTTTLSFVFRVGEKTEHSNRLFVPLSSAQIEAIQRYRVTPAKPSAGIVKVVVDTAKRHIVLKELFPITGTAPIPSGLPEQIGIGSATYNVVTGHLARSYPGHTFEHEVLLPTGEAMVRKMGITPSKTYAIEDYAERVRSYVDRKRA